MNAKRFAGVQELTDEQRAEIDTLRTDYGDVERHHAAALIAEDVPEETRTDETAEDREIRGRVGFARYAGAAMKMRAGDGAESEYNAELGIAANQFPLELLAPPMEQRATTDTESGVNQQSWLDRLSSPQRRRLASVADDARVSVHRFHIR